MEYVCVGFVVEWEVGFVFVWDVVVVLVFGFL